MKEKLNSTYKNNLSLNTAKIIDEESYIENILSAYYIKDFNIKTEEDLLFSFLFC